MKKTNLLLAGATGYLGRCLLQSLADNQQPTRAIARNPHALDAFKRDHLSVVQAEVTQPETLKGVCDGMDVVISTVGITRQKDGLTYQDVDYQANMNLLKEAEASGVKHFIYVSAINGDQYRNLKIFAAKEAFVDELKQSPIAHTIVRPNGFFSDMKDFMDMAQRGRAYVFGDGNARFNPIHGDDLAQFIFNLIEHPESDVSVGGPDVLSLNEVATLALTAMNKPVKITRIPDWIRVTIIKALRTFASVSTYGPIEFFLTLMASDNIAPTYGNHQLEAFFNQQAKQMSTHPSHNKEVI